MDVLKGIAIGLLSFLLFLCLSVFGVAHTVKSTALNPDFVTSEINRLDVSTLIKDFLIIEPTPEFPELENVVYEAVDNLEPIVKERLDITIHAVYEYFPDDTENLKLNSLLRENFLTAEFVSSVVDKVDVSTLAGPFIVQQLKDYIYLDVELESLEEFLEDAIEDTVREAKPEIREQLVAIADPVFDYLLMQSPTLDASISLVDIKEILEDNLRQSLSESPPPEIEMIPEEMRLLLFDAFYDELAEQIPSAIVVDESVIDPEIPDDINMVLADIEDVLVEASIYVNYFQMAYTLLIVLMVVFVLGIILIIRDVKIISRRLGVPLISYGAIQYAGIWAARYFMGGQMLFDEFFPASFEIWFTQFTNNLLRPLEIFSLVLLITGVILFVISYVYKRGEAAD